MRFKILDFEYTWCDFLTPCPHRENIEIGSFDCSECKYFISSRNGGTTNKEVAGDYTKYSKIMKGVVFCTHPNNFNKN